MIGVFDSGFGGLTVHRALIEALPERDFVYLGDNRNAPYGLRSPIDVLNLTCAALERLFEDGCTLIVLACNTASTVALRWIQQQWLPVRYQEDEVARNVIGIVVPTIESAIGFAWDESDRGQHTKQSGTIAVFATRRTVDSNCYPIEIRKRRPDMTVVQQPCPELAGAIELGRPPGELREMVNRYVRALLDRLNAAPECVILGCTHYPLVADLFADALPGGVRIIHQPEATARALRAYLDRHPEYDRSGGAGRKFLSTGFSREALAIVERFWGQAVPFLKV